MSKITASTLPLPKFKGGQEKFGMYNTQIKAYLLVKRMAGVLDNKFQDKLPFREDVVLDPTKMDETVQMVLLEMNTMAMDILINFFTTKDLLNKIYDTMLIKL